MEAQIKTRIWNGCIPTLIHHESSQEPFHLLLKRNSYLPFYSCSILEYFNCILETPILNENQIWYSIHSEPLKWHLPIGLLYDLYGQESVPFQIQIHFNEYPMDALLRYESKSSLQDNYMNTLKESDYLRYGSAKKVMGLSKKDQLSLWSSIEKDDYTTFDSIQSGLILQDLDWKFLTIRLYSLNPSYSMEQFKIPWPENQDISITDTLKPLVGREEFVLILHGIRLKGNESTIWYF